MNKTAMITGIGGQDAAWLTELLLKKGYRVIGTTCSPVGARFWRLEELGVSNQILIVGMDLLNGGDVIEVISKYTPDELYNFGAQSSVSVSFSQPVLTHNINALGILRLLEAIRQHSPHTRIFQAGSAEIFGANGVQDLTESSPFMPQNPYGISKLSAYYSVSGYKEAYGIFGCNGILFNHESLLRGEEFVTRKTTRAFAAIKEGKQGLLELGNLDTSRDWGSAQEYVFAMWKMLQGDEADNFIISTGETHTLREFVQLAAKGAGYNLKWKGTGEDEEGYDDQTGKTLVKVNPTFFRPVDNVIAVAKPSKIRKILGWQHQTSFSQLVKDMIDADLSRASQL